MGAFLKQKQVLFNRLGSLLEQRLERLTPFEKDLMYLLFIRRKLFSLAELEEKLDLSISLTTVLEALGSLLQRSLIERGEGELGFRVLPMVQDQVNAHLAELARSRGITGS